MRFDAATWGVTQSMWTQILSNVYRITMDVDRYQQFTDTIGFDNFQIRPRASCTFRNGSGINPSDFTCSTLPVLGTSWVSAIDTNPQTLSTLIGISLSPGQYPLLGGEVLLGLSPPPVFQLSGHHLTRTGE